MAAQLHTLLPEDCDHPCDHLWPLPPGADAVSAVRRRARAVLRDWSVTEAIAEDALLVVSELLTNAVVHALPPAVLRLSWTGGDGRGTLRVEVTDAGPTRPCGQPPPGIDPDEHGRGEEIVHALAARHGIRVHPDGVTRWADLVAVCEPGPGLRPGKVRAGMHIPPARGNP